MSDPSRVDERMDEFARAWRAGEADPRVYLADLEGEERQEMTVRMRLFLDRAAPDAWDPERYPGSLSEQVAEGVLGEAREAGREDLIGMRVERGLGKHEVAVSLADDLGATSEVDRQKVSDYYHRLEWGTLDPSAISRKVIDSIAAILRSDRRGIIEAIPEPGATSHEVFARLSTEPSAGVPGERSASMQTPSSGAADWVDELFAGSGEGQD